MENHCVLLIGNDLPVYLSEVTRHVEVEFMRGREKKQKLAPAKVELILR